MENSWQKHLKFVLTGKTKDTRCFMAVENVVHDMYTWD